VTRCAREECRRARPEWLIERRRLGMRIDGSWFCSHACGAADAARRMRETRSREREASIPTPRLGTLLTKLGVVDAHQLHEALQLQRTTGLRLGAQLVALGYATREAILRALAMQQGVRYLAVVDVTGARLAPGSLTLHELRAFGAVPLRAGGGSLAVACPAPLPRAGLAALHHLTQQDIEPFLVSDDDYMRLVTAYAAAASTLPDVDEAGGIEEGAARIASLAEESRSVTMTQAFLAPFTWIRVAAGEQIRTLVVAADADHFLEGRQSWPAATTPR